MSCGRPTCQQQQQPKCTAKCLDDVNVGITFNKNTNRYNVHLNGADAGTCATRNAAPPASNNRCSSCVTLCPPSCPEPHCLNQCQSSCQGQGHGQGPPRGCCMEKCGLPRCPWGQNPCNECRNNQRYNRW